ncbi:MAG: Hsp20/alpha crystallin family protein [Cyclobacteriaceae bacterium]
MQTIKRRNSLNKVQDGFQNVDLMEDVLTSSDSNMTPTINVAENDSQFTIDIGVFGMTKENYSIQILNNSLLVEAKKGEDFFARTFTIPEWVNNDEIVAKTENGMLTIVLPKDADTLKQFRRIDIV